MDNGLKSVLPPVRQGRCANLEHTKRPLLFSHSSYSFLPPGQTAEGTVRAGVLIRGIPRAHYSFLTPLTSSFRRGIQRVRQGRCANMEHTKRQLLFSHSSYFFLPYASYSFLLSRFNQRCSSSSLIFARKVAEISASAGASRPCPEWGNTVSPTFLSGAIWYRAASKR